MPMTGGDTTYFPCLFIRRRKSFCFLVRHGEKTVQQKRCDSTEGERVGADGPRLYRVKKLNGPRLLNGDDYLHGCNLISGIFAHR
jgi:hypothetical protein